jgi:hypothetical protein
LDAVQAQRRAPSSHSQGALSGDELAGLHTLQQLGIVERVKRRALLAWNNGGRRWQQLPSAFLFRPRCESTGRPDSQTQQTSYLVAAPLPRAQTVAQAALDAVRQRWQWAIMERLGRRAAPC